MNVHLRIAVAAGAGAEDVEGELVNIAADGMLVRAPIDAPSQSSIVLRFRMLGNRECEARGRVTAQTNGDLEIGLEQRSPDMERFLGELEKLPVPLRPIYLADVLQPRLDVAG